jgi:hypothetical protein
MTGVRFREGSYEGRCDACATYWPLGPEFWDPHSGLRRCRACIVERRRLETLARREYKRDWMRRFRAARRRAELRRVA